jgi:uncharacterized membrane protein YdjX (TVP38/TMEM64 family)
LRTSDSYNNAPVGAADVDIRRTPLKAQKQLVYLLLPFGIAVLVIALLAWLLPVSEWLTLAMTKIFYLGYWGFLIYYAAYVALAGLAVPMTPLNVAAGVLFSLWSGFLAALAGALTSAVLVFLFARYLASDRIRARLERIDGCEKFLEGVADEGIKVVALTRCNPFVPATIKNFGFAITDLPLHKFVAGTFLGQLPVVFVHVYLGWVGGVAMMRGEAPPGSFRWIMIGAAILATGALGALFYWLIQRRRQRA